jgi:hypothetical protein
LTPEDDGRIQTELRRRNDLFSQALLLTRLTGMRIGETVDLAADCLRHLGGDQWVLHVPVGKLHNERWTPVDEQGRTLIARLRFLGTRRPCSAGVSVASSQGPRCAVRPVARRSLRRGYPSWDYRSHRAAPVEAHLRHDDDARRVSACRH